MSILVTGVAGFIGMHVAKSLLDRGERVIGIDNLNSYYDPRLKHARLAELEGRNGFTFERLDFSDAALTLALADRLPDLDRIVHLGAQAGVRWSIDHPADYLSANLSGQLSILELARRLGQRSGCRKLVYASSSSVYGVTGEMPFRVGQSTDSPVSFYGATKKAGEVMTHSYAHLYRIPSIGLRFFTVYGPWGRPDMSPWLFTSHIVEGRPIQVFNNGEMQRDFTYIDDIVQGVVAALDLDMPEQPGAAPHRIYNLGNNRPVALMRYIEVIAEACGRAPVIELKPMQPGDVPATYADIAESARDLGFRPETPIEVGIPRFVEWYRRYSGT
jgi:UDP-glucuronate 4-epimerase